MRQLVLLLAAFCGSAIEAQEFVLPEPAEEIFVGQSAFAVDGSARKALPSVDCWHCLGPTACAPCEQHHAGFMYYETCADIGGATHCDDHERGDAAASLSRAWIKWREKRTAWWHGRSNNCGGNCSP